MLSAFLSMTDRTNLDKWDQFSLFWRSNIVIFSWNNNYCGVSDLPLFCIRVKL